MSHDATWLASMPERYDTCLGPALFAPYAEHVASLVRQAAPARVLEVAAGTGIGTAALVAALPEAEVLATDLNAAMVAWSAPRVPRARWAVADAQDLSAHAGAFDAVVCQFGVMFFPDRPAAYRQLAAALRPGGRLVLTVWDEVSTCDLPAALTSVLQELFPADAPDFVVRVPHGYAAPALIRDELEAAGLVDVDVQQVELQGAPVVPSVYAEGVCLGTPLRFELDKRGPLDVLRRQIGERMDQRLGTVPVAGSLSAYVVRARRLA